MKYNHPEIPVLRLARATRVAAVIATLPDMLQLEKEKEKKYWILGSLRATCLSLYEAVYARVRASYSLVLHFAVTLGRLLGTLASELTYQTFVLFDVNNAVFNWHMSVSLVVIRLELADQSPLPQGFQYCAGEYISSVDAGAIWRYVSLWVKLANMASQT